MVKGIARTSYKIQSEKKIFLIQIEQLQTDLLSQVLYAKGYNPFLYWTDRNDEQFLAAVF